MVYVISLFIHNALRNSAQWVIVSVHVTGHNGANGSSTNQYFIAMCEHFHIIILEAVRVLSSVLLIASSDHCLYWLFDYIISRPEMPMGLFHFLRGTFPSLWYPI